MEGGSMMEVSQRKSSARSNKSLLPQSSTQLPTNVNSASASSSSFWQRFCCYCFETDDASYLAFFRVLWGLIMFWEVYTLIPHGYSKMYYLYYLNPVGFTFKYPPYDFVELMSEEHMKIFIWFMLFVATCICVGFMFRLFSTIFFFGIAYLFLVEANNYLNHMYLVTMMAFLMIFLPCNCCYSVDVVLFPSVRQDRIPKLVLFFLQAVLVIVYAFAGVVKMNEDWLRAEPLRHWLAKRAMRPYLGWVLRTEPLAYFFSYGGIVYDVVVGPMLLFKRTLWLGILMSMFFHLSNKAVFNIGIFPWLMIASTTLFLPPEWPRRLIDNMAFRRPYRFQHVKKTTLATVKTFKLSNMQKLALAMALIFLTFWVVFPLRHYFIYDGDVVWNEQGHNYSWRMKLRDKQCGLDAFGFSRDGNISFSIPVHDFIHPNHLKKILPRPWMIIQLAHLLADLYTTDKGIRPEIYLPVTCSLNFRPTQPFTDPTIDLAAEPKWPWNYRWVTQLEPLPEKYYDQYPWNWQWNFNWLKADADLDNYPEYQQDVKEQHEQFRKLTRVHTDKFLRVMADRHYGGNIDKVVYYHDLHLDDNALPSPPPPSDEPEAPIQAADGVGY